MLSGIDLTNYEIRGSEQDWQKALAGSGEKKGLLSVKRLALFGLDISNNEIRHLELW